MAKSGTFLAVKCQKPLAGTWHDGCFQRRDNSIYTCPAALRFQPEISPCIESLSEVRMKLPCGKEPEIIGKSQNGKWDFMKFGEHLTKCPDCKTNTAEILRNFTNNINRRARRRRRVVVMG